MVVCVLEVRYVSSFYDINILYSNKSKVQWFLQLWVCAYSVSVYLCTCRCSKWKVLLSDVSLRYISQLELIDPRNTNNMHIMLSAHFSV